MPVQHIRPQTLDFLVTAPESTDIPKGDLPPDRQADDAERQEGRDIVEQTILMRAARQAVAKNTDLVACLALFLRQIPDMTEDSADRRSEAVKDTKWSGHERTRLEQPLSDVDGVACQYRIGNADPSRHDMTVDLAGDIGIGLVGSAAEAARNSDRVLDRHARHVGILAGLPDFTHDIDRAITVDVYGDVGVADISLPKLLRDLAGKLLQGPAAGSDLTDQWEGNVAGLINRIGIGQPGLVEHRHAQAVAAVKRIGLDRGFAEGFGRRLIGVAAGERGAHGSHAECKDNL